MKNKKILAYVGLVSSLAMAQTGLSGGTDGLHQQSARTLGQWVVSVGVGAEVTTDNEGMARGGYYYDADGNLVAMDRIVPMVAGNAHLGIGLTDFWDLGAVLPLNYDGVNPATEESHLRGAGIGDVQMWTKLRAPFDTVSVFNMAILAEAYAPTGSDNVGMKPRHQWYVDSWGNSSAYTANDWAFGGTLILTLDLTRIDIPVRWNSHLGYVGVIGEGANSAVWGTGLNVLASTGADFFVEFSGETRIEKTDIPREPFADPMLLTPGVRVHLPAGFDLALGADISINSFLHNDYEGEKTMPVTRTKDGKTITYSVPGTSHYGISALLNWSSAFLKDSDDDGDGVYNKKDLCAHTPFGASTDSAGCPTDEDKDGIPDFKDKCANTEKGIEVDSNGCNRDTDRDGVVDLLDKCPNTEAKVAVNKFGCPMDSDKDGVADNKDKCPNTRKGSPVDVTGCPTDADKDGVADLLDKCPRSPVGSIVDSIGCPMDTDKDGIFDHVDKCPKTPMGAVIDSVGCPVDLDKDGVLDYKDKCLNTPEKVMVDSVGCPTDADKDGVADRLDKCPNTALGTIVDTIGCPKDTDKDGVFDFLDKCPNTPIGFSVDSTGCTMDTDKDGVANLLDKCPNTPVGMTVDSTGCILDSDKDGVADVLDKCPSTQPKMSVDSTGCVLDSDKDGVSDADDKCPSTLPGVKIKPNGCPVDKKQDLTQLKKGINFKKNSASLTNASYSTLDDIVALLRQIPVAKLEVQGHTDNKGKKEYNLNLSQKRSESVVNYFIKKGIEPNRVRAIGYGSERPIADNNTSAGRETNRRVELVPFE